MERSYIIGATLKVDAGNIGEAKERASLALLSLANYPHISGAWVDREARLFPVEAFAQMQGQTSLETDS